MKKLALVLCLAVIAACNVHSGILPDAWEKGSFGKSLLLWAPNRILDLTDLISVGVGVGGVQLEARITRAIDISAGDGFQIMLKKDYNRQLGIAFEQGHHFNFIYFGCEHWQVNDSLGIRTFDFPVDDPGKDFCSIKTGNIRYNYWVSPCHEKFAVRKGMCDWWEIAVEAACGPALRLAVHPIELIDFVCGIFFYDFKEDDIKSGDY